MTRREEAKEGAGMWRYLKEAFSYRWNLLLFGGGAAAALIVGSAGVALPLVAAGELLYLTGLASNSRFQAAIDAKAHREAHPPGQAATQRKRASLTQMLRDLDAPRRQRFLALRERCRQMGRIARGVAGQSTITEPDLSAAKLDRLLWAFLRLLYSDKAIHSFLAVTDRDTIEAQLTSLRSRQAQAKERGDERILRSLTDSVATAELRLANYDKAEQNAEFVAVELDRIEGKIQALVEMAVSHEDPDFLSDQVDSVAESMASTETAIREMRLLTGLSDEMDEAPEILEVSLDEVFAS